MADFNDLPDEVIVQIFSYLPVSCQVAALSRVSHRFKSLVSSVWYWRTSYVTAVGSKPLVELATVREWQTACLQNEFPSTASKKLTLKGVKI